MATAITPSIIWQSERMVLTGNQAEVTDPERGSTKGPRITWLSRYDKLVVEGEKRATAFRAVRPRTNNRSSGAFRETSPDISPAIGCGAR